MNVQVTLSDGPLGVSSSSASRTVDVGAVLVFEGIVRADEGGRTLRGLRYEADEPMTTTMLRTIAEQVGAAHEALAIDVEHSVGDVPVGQCSFRLTVCAGHRKEALAAADDFIDRMKRDVPLWKVPVWAQAMENEAH